MTNVYVTRIELFIEQNTIFTQIYREHVFLNLSAEKQGLVLQLCTKLDMFCVGIFLKTEDCEGHLFYTFG
jgi:hypothetical protein